MVERAHHDVNVYSKLSYAVAVADTPASMQSLVVRVRKKSLYTTDACDAAKDD